jgi:hypothetical protein
MDLWQGYRFQRVVAAISCNFLDFIIRRKEYREYVLVLLFAFKAMQISLPAPSPGMWSVKIIFGYFTNRLNRHNPARLYQFKVAVFKQNALYLKQVSIVFDNRQLFYITPLFDWMSSSLRGENIEF